MFSEHLTEFVNVPTLSERVSAVLMTLPKDVLRDLLEEPRVLISVDNYQPGKGSTVWMAPPSADDYSRCVVLKPKLADCPEDFAFYVIAHEFAHAFLRNGAWGDITDAEEAADALAAHWGHTRPDGPYPW
jgi:hypothetical protein